MDQRMKLLLILIFVVANTKEAMPGRIGVEFDEDDDIDPYDDDGEHIEYPVKSVMPERARPKDDTKILPHEGSGVPFQRPVLDFQMTGRLENLENSLVLLTAQLQQQRLTNSELNAALAAQQEQRVREKTAFVNAIGVLQGAVSKLAYQVDKVPSMIEKEKKTRYKDYVASKLNSMSERIGQMSSRLDKEEARGGNARDTRSHCIGSSADCENDVKTRSTDEPDAAGALLSKLLGKDIQKALAGLSFDNKAKTEAKDITSAATQVQPAIVPQAAAASSQALTPIDLLPQSHLTSLSTPTGQGPAGSISTNPVVPNLSYVQVPSQTNIAAPSTPTGSGPVGSASTITPALGALQPPKTVSLSSFASKFKPPANLGGYNVLPLVPVPPVQAQQPLEAPGIISPQPALPSLTDAIAPVPGVVNPYEVLTSAQMPLNVAPPLAFNGAAPLPETQTGNPYELLTTSQMGVGGYPVVKGKVTDNNKAGKKGNIKMQPGKTPLSTLRKQSRAKKAKASSRKRKEMASMRKDAKKKKDEPAKKDSKGEKLEDLNKDPFTHDLIKALGMGNLKKDELLAKPKNSTKGGGGQ